MLYLIDLIDYIPPYLKEYKTLSNILLVQNDFLNQMERDLLFLMENSFVLTADTFGIERFEKMLEIKPYSYDTLDIRRQRILTKLDTKVPYTLEVLKKKIETIVGTNYTLNISYEDYLIEIITTINEMQESKMLNQIIEEYVPVNVIVNAISNLYYSSSIKYYVANGLTATKKYYIK